MLTWLAIATLAHAEDCPDVEAHLPTLQSQVVEIRLEQARDTVGKLHRAFACGQPLSEPKLLTLWTLEAMLEIFSGDADAASPLLEAAWRLDPQLDVSDYGPAAVEALEAVQAEAGATETGSLEFDNVPDGARFWIDGRMAKGIEPLTVGLHLVQVCDAEPRAHFGRIVRVTEGQTVRLPLPDLDLTPAPSANAAAEQAAVTVAPPEPAVAPNWQPWLALGAHGGLGTSQQGSSPSGQSLTEPAFKAALPLELGVVFRAEPGPWVRGAIAAQPLLNGAYVYAAGGDVLGWPLLVGAHVSGGTRLGNVDLGLGSGIALPGRIPVFGLAHTPLGDLPLGLELRVGAHAVAERAAEPFGTVLVNWQRSTGSAP